MPSDNFATSLYLLWAYVSCPTAPMDKNTCREHFSFRTIKN